jgi:phosphoribosylformimino-5-aminoimidazole carboxamide ribotide isomerase
LVPGSVDVSAFCVIPAIDLRGGRCVRLVQGDYGRETVYGDDPLGQALRWVGAGAERIHVVDLDAARTGDPVNLPIVRAIAAAVAVPIQLGGGIRDRDGVRRALDAGVDRAILGTAAARDPDAAGALFAEFADRLILGLDARDGRIAVAGWCEETPWSAIGLGLRLRDAGAGRVIYTDIATDGTGSGPSLASTRRLAEALAIPVIASGGVGSIEHIRQVATLADAGVEGIIVGRALYAGQVDLAEAIRVVRAAGAAG